MLDSRVNVCESCGAVFSQGMVARLSERGVLRECPVCGDNKLYGDCKPNLRRLFDAFCECLGTNGVVEGVYVEHYGGGRYRLIVRFCDNYFEDETPELPIGFLMYYVRWCPGPVELAYHFSDDEAMNQLTLLRSVESCIDVLLGWIKEFDEMCCFGCSFCLPNSGTANVDKALDGLNLGKSSIGDLSDFASSFGHLSSEPEFIGFENIADMSSIYGGFNSPAAGGKQISAGYKVGTNAPSSVNNGVGIPIIHIHIHQKRRG